MPETQPFPFAISVDVAFRDIDALGHVNHAVYLSYMETARIKFMVHVFQLASLSELSMVLAEARCSYHSPAFFGERLNVGMGVSRFGTKSFDMVYRIDAADGRLVASGKTVQVMYDYRANASTPIPAEFRERILAFQNGWSYAE